MLDKWGVSYQRLVQQYNSDSRSAGIVYLAYIAISVILVLLNWVDRTVFIKASVLVFIAPLVSLGISVGVDSIRAKAVPPSKKPSEQAKTKKVLVRTKPEGSQKAKQAKSGP